MTPVVIEMIGYLGSILVIISMLMSSVIKLRVINTIGSCIFAAYALIIHSYPTAAMNFFLVGVNVYNLMKLLKTNQEYDLVDGNAEESFLNYFLEYYKNDIQIYFPQFQKDNTLDVAYLVCCNASPAGIFLGKKGTDGEIEVVLDYATPAYRDCTVGKYLYSEMARRGVRQVRFSGKAEHHDVYMQKIGYVEVNGVFIKKLGQ